MYFIAYIFILLSLAVVLTAVLFGVFSYFLERTMSLPLFIWILLVSIAIGTGATAFFNKKILSPVMDLSDGLAKVAAGDFTIQLHTDSAIREIRDSYGNFNTMVRELQATQIIQSDFVANVSHEFKTPINAIEGYATLLQDPSLEPAEQGEFVDKILFNTRRLSELVGNILLLSKVENQIIDLERSQYRLDEQIRKTVLSLEPKWLEKEIEFDVELEEILFYGNEGLMLHVWMNLLDNAIKFDPQGGSVKIRLYRQGKSVVCTIADNGPGIGPEAQKHIFQKFYQADSSHRAQGNGLGLALVAQILDRCGGRISVWSQPGQGAAFTVTLPVGQEQEGNRSKGS